MVSCYLLDLMLLNANTTTRFACDWAKSSILVFNPHEIVLGKNFPIKNARLLNFRQ
jgi:hypothetical protein